MDNLAARIRRLMITVNRIDGLYYLAARSLGMKYNTFALLYALSDGGTYSQKQICEDWLIPKTTLNTVVHECEDAGYVTLTRLGNKEKAVCLTERGQAWAERALELVREAELTALERTLPAVSNSFDDDFAVFAEQLRAAMEPLLRGQELDQAANDT